MKKIRFGILGYAGIAVRALIPALMKTKNAALYALASGKAESRDEARAKHPSLVVYERYEDLLNDPAVDAVYIPLPNSLHKEWAIKAMRAKKHVLCEKPMALTTEDALEMAEESRKNSVVLMEAFMYRFHNKTKLLQKLLSDGLIGDIRHVSSGFSFVFDRPGDYRNQKEMGGGAFWDVGCYAVNMAGLIFQEEPVTISAVKNEKNGIDVSLTALLQYPSGATCTVTGGFDSQSMQVTQINGTMGSLLLRDSFLGPATPILHLKDNKVTEIKAEECDCYAAQVEAFSDAVLTGCQPPFSLEETIRNIDLIVRILDAARQTNLPCRTEIEVSGQM